VAETTVRGGGQRGKGPGGGGDVVVTLLEDPAKSKTYVLRAIATDALGRQLPSDRIHWHDAQGGELGRGPTLDTRSLPRGRNVVRAVFADPSLPETAATGWLVERRGAGAIVHHEINEQPPTPRAVHTHPHPAPTRPPRKA